MKASFITTVTNYIIALTVVREWTVIQMADYISRDAVINITAETGAWETQNRVRELPSEDVQPVNKWINIKDKLPEIGRSVLIYYSPWEGGTIQVAKLDRDRLTFDICGEFNVGVGIVTHWMPLPESPKEG